MPLTFSDYRLLSCQISMYPILPYGSSSFPCVLKGHINFFDGKVRDLHLSVSLSAGGKSHFDDIIMKSIEVN